MADDVLASGWSKFLGGDRKQFDMFFNRMLDGFAYHKIVVDKAGKPVDYVFLEVNHAFERMTGLKRGRIIGRRVTEVLPGIEKDTADLIGVYGHVALTGESVQFEKHVEPFGEWYKVSAYCPEKGYFVALLEDITERKQLECEIESLSKFPSENPNPIFRIDGKGIFLYCNQVGVSFLAAWNSKVGGHAPEHIGQVVAGVLASDKRVEVEETFGAKTFSLLFVPVILEGYVNIYGNDITERKKGEEALKESEHLYRTVFDNSQDGFQLIELLYDEKGKPYDHKFLRVNCAYEKIMGVRAKDVTGKTARYISPNCESYWFEVPERVAKSGRSEHVELYNKDINKYLDCYYFSYSENAVGTLFRDVTGGKQAQQAIERQASLIDLSPDAIIVTKFDRTITFWSKGAEKLYGWTRSEAVGQKSHVLFKTRFPEPLRDIVSQVELSGQWSGELYHITKDGRNVVVQSWWLVEKDERGEVKSVLESNVDITERKAMENEIKQSVEKLKQSNAELEQFAYVASHDLQEPLRMVASYVQLLERRYKGKLDADADEFIAYAVDGANRMRGLIDDLLIYSRVSRLGKPFEPTDLESTLDTVLKNLQASIAENGAAVTHDKLPVVMADGGQLVQLLQNLIGNAIKFHGKDPPHVHVSAQVNENEYLFSVQDNGIGIAPEYFDRLFKIFQRLHTREEYPGSGIGLAVCKKIVERHGGRIWIESQVGKGSTIYFTLNKQKGVSKKT
ncbi:MAG: PAS domain S-box protein [Candidatus Bathyarchaeia archaeon]